MNNYSNDKYGPFPPGISGALESSINSFCGITQVPVTFYDTGGETKWECLSKNKICALFDIYQKPGSICRKNMASAAGTCAKLGEPYVFVCPAGFVKIVVSLFVDGVNLGRFMAGPIIMGSLKESTVKKIFQLNRISVESYPKLLMFLKSMKSYEPKDVESLRILLNACVLASIAGNRDYSELISQSNETTKINEEMQKYKSHNEYRGQTTAPEHTLMEKLRRGDFSGAEEALLFLLHETSLLESGGEVRDMAGLAEKVIGGLRDNLTAGDYTGNSKVIEQAVKIINENYMNKITLHDISQGLHVNQSYLSVLFKNEIGVSFTDYLGEIRIQRCKYLLSNTHLSLVDIAANTGFEDQSYFTKVFKKKVGVTPTQFRKMERKKRQD